VRMATDGRVETVDGGEVAVEIRSLCIHGDTPGAVALAKAVRAALDRAGVRLEAFA
jgi:5-oxoprolinase (ATP-hydrolysing) subunit A